MHPKRQVRTDTGHRGLSPVLLYVTRLPGPLEDREGRQRAEAVNLAEYTVSLQKALGGLEDMLMQPRPSFLKQSENREDT